MLSTVIAGIPLDSCIYNASGPRTGSIEALNKIGESNSGAILSKSATLIQQEGNPLPRFVNKIYLGEDYAEGSLNSEGLPNLGINYYIGEEALTNMAKFSKPYIVSISGLSLDDNLTMINKILSITNVSAIELNLACPNIPGKPNIAYDFEQMEEVLSKVSKLQGISSKPLGIKLAPYFDFPHVVKVVEIILKYPVIRYIVSINTIGNALMVDVEKECALIMPKGGFGGLGGGFVKPTALANVRMLTEILRDKGRSDIDVVGVGGIRNGRDAFEMILCGAKAVQVGTCHWTEGAGCFKRISEELMEIMKSKGYNSIEDFRGKLKTYVKPDRKTQVTKSTGKNDSKSSLKEFKEKYLVAILIMVIAVLLSIDIWRFVIPVM
jgi:dihydroorotate dehydrogenase (fumarate)